MACHFAVDPLGLRDQSFEIAGLLLKDGRHVGRDLRPIGHEASIAWMNPFFISAACRF